MGAVSVRCIVNDVDAAIPFYTEMLGFKVEMHAPGGFASLSRGDLVLLLRRPGAGGGGAVDARPARCPPLAAGTVSRSSSTTSRLRSTD